MWTLPTLRGDMRSFIGILTVTGLSAFNEWSELFEHCFATKERKLSRVRFQAIWKHLPHPKTTSITLLSQNFAEAWSLNVPQSKGYFLPKNHKGAHCSATIVGELVLIRAFLGRCENSCMTRLGFSIDWCAAGELDGLCSHPIWLHFMSTSYLFLNWVRRPCVW